MPVVNGRPRRFRQRRNLLPAVSAAEHHEPPRQASPLGSLAELQKFLPKPEDDLSDASSVAGSETSLDLDDDPVDDSDGSSDGSSDDSDDEDSHDDSSDGEKAADIGASYLQRIAQYEEDGPVLANRGDCAMRMISAEQRKWIEFCDFLTEGRRVVDPEADSVDPDELLKKCHAPTFKSYLHWRCKYSRIKKESSLVTYWKVLCMFYADKCAAWVDGKVLFDVGNWIPVVIVPEFGLDSSIKNKSGLYVGDLDLILHHLWVLDQSVFAHERQREEIALALVLAGATATRPGTLIGNLCYKDVEFHVFPPAPGSQRARIGLVVTLRKTKRTAGKSRPKKFGFHEEDTLLRDPILYMESLAFADGAFENDFRSPDDIYDLAVPAGQPRLILPWKEEWRNRPIFQLSYDTARKLLIKLGRALGYEKMLEWYDLRRGSGKKLNKALTPEERNHSMGHLPGDSSTYVKFYMSDFIEADFQEIVFGSEPQRDLIHLMGRLMRRGDAPTQLTDEQMAEIHNNKKLAKLRRRKQRVVHKLKKTGWTLRSAPKEGRGAALLARHGRFSRRADTLRKTLYDACLTRAIHEFHSSKDGQEIARQLNGIKPSVYLAPPTIQYQLPTRARIAKLFSEVADITGRDGLFAIRMQLVQELAQLCQQRESRRRKSKGSTRKSSKTPAAPKSLSKAVRRGSGRAKPQQTTVPKSEVATAAGPRMPSKAESTSMPSSTRDPASPPPVPAILSKSEDRTTPAAPKPQGTSTTAPPTGTLLTCPFCHRDADPTEHKCSESLELPVRCPYGYPICQGILGSFEHFVSHVRRQHRTDGDETTPSRRPPPASPPSRNMHGGCYA